MTFDSELFGNTNDRSNEILHPSHQQDDAVDEELKDSSQTPSISQTTNTEQSIPEPEERKLFMLHNMFKFN